MVKRKKICLLFCALVLGGACAGLSACGGEFAGRNDNSTEVVSKGAVSGEAVSGSGVSGDRKRSKMYAKTPEDLSVSFKIQEKTEQGYHARVKISPEEEGLWDWELYLELEDEITEITGAEIVSREENRYIIRGTEENRDIKIYEDGYFDVSVSCQGQIHEPEVCYLIRQEDYMGKKDYECRAADVERTGDFVKGTLVLTNHSEKKAGKWLLHLDTYGMKINSLEGARIVWEEEDEEESEHYYDICGEGSRQDLGAGERMEIAFTAEAQKEKAGVGKEFEMVKQVDTEIDWSYYETAYGARYGKMDQYLVGDSVKGVDLFFVFEEKYKDSYCATAELTNVMEDPVADWEICLECEDEIEEISGAEILSHEGNMYRIRAKDRKKWIPPYGMVTFQVKVSCTEKIHPLGKVYLAKARFQDEEGKTEDGRKEIHIREKDLKEAAGPCWLPYNILYEKDQSATNKYWERSYGPDDFETYEEYKAYVDRNEWGEKMGR